jgi:hypothetical protein
MAENRLFFGHINGAVKNIFPPVVYGFFQMMPKSGEPSLQLRCTEGAVLRKSNGSA